MVAVLLTATLFGVWLTTPVPDVLSRNQWRGVAFAGATLLGILWSLARWNLSTLAIGFSTGVLVGGTQVALPISHGRMGDAFNSNLELFGAEIVSLTVAATVSAYCVSCFRRNHG
jgi:hypothetical protein